MDIKTTYRKTGTALCLLVLPFLIGCSVLGGNSYSNDPRIRAQQEQIDYLEAEYREAEREAEEAEQRKKAAKNRLKAAEHELKALKSQAEGN